MQKAKKFFFIGIGGIGMSGIAIVLRKRGFAVVGSDRRLSATTERLSKEGIVVYEGHSAEHITPDLDVVVYTNAVSEDNPELMKARELGIPTLERAVMLNEVASTKMAIGVSGTHGKTTTTSMISKIFLNANRDPSLAVGGVLEDIEGTGYEGQGKEFIYEACEAFGSILHLHPDMVVVTNVDGDHLDYYGTFDEIKNAFVKYLSENIPPHGVVIYNADDAPLREVVQKANPVQAVSVGFENTSSDFVISDVNLDEFSSDFLLSNKGHLIGSFHLNVPGQHNVLNAALAVVTAHLNGISEVVIAEALGKFHNAQRRFQLKVQEKNFMVIDDYAHHPSEIKATLSAAKNLSTRKKAQLIAIFQPHLYSRTEYFFKDFAKSLSQADRVVLTDIYAAREQNTHHISSKLIYDEVVKLKGEKNVVFSGKLSDVPDKVRSLLNGNDVLITLGAGDVWKVSENLHSH